MTYIPNPIDTSGIIVPPELTDLQEYLAKNIHEVWAKERIAQGWQYGERTDNTKKLHSDLVPYEDLPENEKTFDRNTSMETIRVILSLGYRILPKESD